TAADAICKTYDVDVGFSSDGINFLSWSLPKSKGLLGRKELVAASAWPEVEANGGKNTDYNEDNIINIESGAIAGACVNNTKTRGYIDYATHGTRMTASMPKRDHDPGLFSAYRGESVLFTGS